MGQFGFVKAFLGDDGVYVKGQDVVDCFSGYIKTQMSQGFPEGWTEREEHIASYILFDCFAKITEFTGVEIDLDALE